MNRYKIFILFCFLGSCTTSNARDYWGAIYVDQTSGIAGTSFNGSTEIQAAKLANATCKKKSKKKYCEPVLTWKNGCGAAAWSSINKSARSGMGETKEIQAEQKALNRCQQIEKDQNCKVVSSVCTNWETWETTSTLIWW